MIFQEPMTSLNPVFTIGSQIGEAVRLHQQTNRAETRNRTIEALRMVGIADPEHRIDDYPHQLSGGMRQRVMIAMALSCNPRLLIADEPTTALDVTIQAQILDLIRELQVRLGLAVILVTHDLGIVSEYADDVTILYAARVMEQAPTAELFRNPLNPYTRGLLESIPGIDGNRHHRLQAIPGSIPSALNPPAGCRFHPRCARAIPKCSEAEPPLENKGPEPLCRLHPRLIPQLRTATRPRPLLERPLVRVEHLSKEFPAGSTGIIGGKSSSIKAVAGVNLEIQPGETLGLVGESGSGKSTLGRLILKLLEPTEGAVYFDGRDLSTLGRAELRMLRQQMQLVFQDPYASLNPRMRVRSIVGEGIEIHKLARGSGKGASASPSCSRWSG